MPDAAELLGRRIDNPDDTSDLPSADRVTIFCRKISYKGQQDAEYIAIHGFHERPVKSYLCSICQAWHLTSIRK